MAISNIALTLIDLGVLMIDGIHIDEHVMLVVLGIDADGKKHVLGVREGATENAAACTALLADLRDRGLRTDRPMLVVIDGAKALARATRNVFGEHAIIQRCQAHYLGLSIIRSTLRPVVETIARPLGITAPTAAPSRTRWRGCSYPARHRSSTARGRW
jgi:transposase-like protein